MEHVARTVYQDKLEESAQLDPKVRLDNVVPMGFLVNVGSWDWQETEVPRENQGSRGQVEQLEAQVRKVYVVLVVTREAKGHPAPLGSTELQERLASLDKAVKKADEESRARLESKVQRAYKVHKGHKVRQVTGDPLVRRAHQEKTD